MTSEDTLIFCQDDEVVIRKLRELSPNIDLLPFSILEPVERGAYVDNGNLQVKTVNSEFSMDLQSLALQGKHNLYNSMAAAISANVLRIKKETIRESLSAFQGVEHRLEKVLNVHRIEFINDSKATNINSTWYALESMKKPTVWIVGGVDKGNDYSMLMDLVKEKVKAIVCLGTDNSKIIKAFGHLDVSMVETQSMEEAVRSAYFLGKDGDAVLLSPACASFDLFDNYEDRGKQFKESVRNL
jgi:UDP-N-acetylmuramoylalanine--D-glutamate ligase